MLKSEIMMAHNVYINATISPWRYNACPKGGRCDALGLWPLALTDISEIESNRPAKCNPLRAVGTRSVGRGGGAQQPKRIRPRG